MTETRSLTGKIWKIQSEGTTVSAEEFAKKTLQCRKLTDSVAQIHYADMAKAVGRIHTAAEKQQKIGIFGDYDCDGITAAAQLVRYCRRHKLEHVVYLPHRVRDGYGLQESQVHYFAAQKVQLLLTVDTGIASQTEVALANSLGIDVIITDHHTPPPVLPDAYAILHPMLEANFPEPHPSGAGVVYALLQALEEGTWTEQDEDTALATMGTIADMVPLLGHNRTLVQNGLLAFQTLPHGPLATLRDATRSTTSNDIAFRIAPRINAAGRMDDPSVALTALLDGGDALAQLDTLNEYRQSETHALYSSAVQSIAEPDAQYVLWSASSKYAPGLIGLIAGRLTEAYGAPSCVVSLQGDTCTASLRSPKAYHITEGLRRCSHLLLSFGGHAQAAGCSFKTSNLQAVKQALTDDVQAKVERQALQPVLSIEQAIRATDITNSFAESLEVLQPFGQGNAEPLFLLPAVDITDIRLVGSEKTHVQCRIHNCKAIGFSLAQFEPYFQKKLDVACRIAVDEWLGKKQPQIFIEDIRLAQTPA